MLGIILSTILLLTSAEFPVAPPDSILIGSGSGGPCSDGISGYWWEDWGYIITGEPDNRVISTDIRLRLFGSIRVDPGPAVVAMVMEHGRTGQVIVKLGKIILDMTPLEFWGRWKRPCQFFEEEVKVI